MMMESQAFKNNPRIPSKYTCDGEDISPPLSWSGAPKETKAYALIMDDHDAPVGVFTHWVVFNILVSESSLQENVPKRDKLPNGVTQEKTTSATTAMGAHVHHHARIDISSTFTL